MMRKACLVFGPSGQGEAVAAARFGQPIAPQAQGKRHGKTEAPDHRRLFQLAEACCRVKNSAISPINMQTSAYLMA